MPPLLFFVENGIPLKVGARRPRRLKDVIPTESAGEVIDRWRCDFVVTIIVPGKNPYWMERNNRIVVFLRSIDDDTVLAALYFEIRFTFNDPLVKEHLTVRLVIETGARVVKTATGKVLRKGLLVNRP